MKNYLFAMITSASLVCLAGCAAEGPADADTELATEVQTIVVTAEDTADLGERDELRHGFGPDTAYHFATEQGPIAFDKITLVLDDGQEVHVEEVVATMAARAGASAEGFEPEPFTLSVSRPASTNDTPGLESAKLATSVCWIINDECGKCGLLYFAYPCITGTP